MAWQVRFIPDEVTSMTMSCNGEHALDWNSSEGDVTKNVPAKWATLPHVHFRADGSPNGDNAHCQILWDGQLRRNMEFDNGEDWDS
jgi:hypothetical protein